jgi:hypothetical protein
MSAKPMKRLFVLLAAGFLALAISPGAQDKSFDLMNVIGEWEGEGTFVMPVTDMELDIEGSGKFVYLPDLDVIRTEMSGSKFLMAYSDSGYLRYYPETDSVSWEIWDSWGKHSLYWGEVRDNQLVATRDHPERWYRVTVEFPDPDTLEFRLVTTDRESLEQEVKARFTLWRTK